MSPVRARRFLSVSGFDSLTPWPPAPRRGSHPRASAPVSGITTLVRLAAWAIAPGFAGLLMTGDAMFLPLVIGAAMKIGYDILL